MGPSMLSVEQCKKHLANNDYTDEQIEEIRENLYQLANVFVEEYLQSKKKNLSLIDKQTVIQK